MQNRAKCKNSVVNKAQNLYGNAAFITRRGFNAQRSSDGKHVTKGDLANDRWERRETRCSCGAETAPESNYRARTDALIAKDVFISTTTDRSWRTIRRRSFGFVCRRCNLYINMLITIFAVGQVLSSYTRPSIDTSVCPKFDSLKCHTNLMRGLQECTRDSKVAVQSVRSGITKHSGRSAGRCHWTLWDIRERCRWATSTTRSFSRALNWCWWALFIHHPLTLYVERVQQQLNHLLHQAYMNLNVLVNRSNWHVIKLQTGLWRV